MSAVIQFLNKSFGVYNIRGIYVEPTYWMAIAIVFLVFLLVLTLARLRYLYVHWSLGKSSISFIFYGFLLAFIVEGFFLIGGRTLFTEILGWENAPKPISTVLDIGRDNLVDVLGVTEEVPSSYAQEPPTYQSVLEDFKKLSDEDREQISQHVCKP